MIEQDVRRALPTVAWATLVAVLIGLPLLNAHVLVPWAIRGVERGDRLVWWAQLAEVIVLHVALSAAICRSLKAEAQPATSIGVHRPRGGHLIAAALIVVAGIAVVVLRHLDVIEVRASDVLAPHGTAERAFFVAESIVIGGLQEPIFRGFAITYLARVTGSVWPAVLLSSAAFGYYHGGFAEPAAVLGTFVGGLFLSGLYLRSRSVWWPMVAHAGFNVVFAAIT